MRRSLAPVFGLASVFMLAACADQSQPTRLLPSEPFMATGGQCDGGLASQLGKEQKDLQFSVAALSDLQNRLKIIKAGCTVPATNTEFLLMMDYLKAMLGYAGLPAVQSKASLLATHLGSMTLYVTGQAVVRSAEVFMGDGLVEGGPDNGVIPDGGAAVLSPGDPQMETYDHQVALLYQSGTTPGGPHLFTWEWKDSSFCQSTLRPNTRCYDLRDYPHETLYTPPLIIAMCLQEHSGPTSLIHTRTNFGTEVLPEDVELTLLCEDTHPSLSSWLRREAGPVGHALARAVDFLGPRRVYASDAGESGSLDAASPVGGGLTVVYEDGFTANATGPLADDTDPVVGDFATSWDVFAPHPAYIEIQNGLGDLTGNVVVLSQALGNCTTCPTVRLLGTRVNPSATDTIGSYEITWQSLQYKPNVKKAPFVVRSYSDSTIAEIAYVTESSANLLKYNGDTVKYNGSPVLWTNGIHHDFKITVNLHTLNGQNSFRTSLAIVLDAQGLPCAPVSIPPNQSCAYRTVVANVPFLATSQRTVSTIGYFLSGIDAGIIAADNFLMKRLADIP